jgi:signal transduction histidine kinase
MGVTGMQGPLGSLTEGITGRILIVDDERAIRMVLRDVLEAEGHEVFEARDGGEALDAIARAAPDVALVDVMMPVADGPEVCRRLRADPATAFLPVLLMTGLTYRDERLRAIRAGASDFLVKPLDAQDVVLRVRNAVLAKRLFERVREDNERLRQLEALRDDLTHMIVHDMKSPLTVASMCLETLAALTEGKLEAEARECIEMGSSTVFGLIEMVNSLLDVSRLEAGEMPFDPAPCDLGSLARDAVRSLRPILQRRHVPLSVPDQGITVHCDAGVIRRVFTNLLANAVRFTDPDGRIAVGVAVNGPLARASVSDDGPGIPAEYHERIFDKFGQAKARKDRQKYTTGLGLTFCKLAVEAHGGTIGLNSEVGHGTEFWFTLPLRQPGS